jgi:hypothetical protein
MIITPRQIFEVLRKVEEHKAHHGSYPRSINEIKLDVPKKIKKRNALSKQ